MARVVQQQRKAPPYALIIFVFLFLVATTLAVYLHIERDKAVKARKEAELRSDKLASSLDLKDPRIIELMKKYDEKVRTSERRETVVWQLVMQVDGLTQKINGVVTTPEDAITQTNALCKQINSYGGLIQMVRSFYEQRNAKETLANDLKKQRDDAQKEHDKVSASYDTLVSQYKTWKDDSKSKRESVERDFTKLTKQQAEVLTKAKIDWDLIRQEKDKKAAELTDKLHAADTKTRQLQQETAALRGKINEMRTRVETITKADGKILSVTEGNFCFINLGAKDGVEPGFTFAVYPQAGIPKDGTNKGSIVVMTTGQDVSRCRVVKPNKTNPAIPDDLVANVAFDSVRKWKFLVEGYFDLHGTGVAIKEGAVEARLLLKRFGATITDKVDVDVDFVVLGIEPPTPMRPEDDAAPHIWEAWRLAMKEQKRYAQVKKQALDMGVTIKNANWLVDMTGYTPVKALRDVARP